MKNENLLQKETHNIHKTVTHHIQLDKVTSKGVLVMIGAMGQLDF